MQDCEIKIVVKNEKIEITGTNISTVELATLAGFMEEMSGYEAYRRGMTIDDIKSNMLDVHQSAMRALEKHIRKERGNGQNEPVQKNE